MLRIRTGVDIAEYEAGHRPIRVLGLYLCDKCGGAHEDITSNGSTRQVGVRRNDLAKRLCKRGSTKLFTEQVDKYGVRHSYRTRDWLGSGGGRDEHMGG